MAALEAEIFGLIDHYPENEASLERIFHLIQIWGGRTGRGIYVNQDFHWAEVVQVYEPFIEYEAFPNRGFTLRVWSL